MMNSISSCVRALKRPLRLSCLFATAFVSASLAHGQTYAHVYDFIGAGNDGSNPNASITFDSQGNLYGTTTEGGVNGEGDVFEITNTGTYIELYSFGNGSDGTFPYSNVTFDANGNMYGTTAEGGAHNLGIVWEISATGTYSDLHDFAGGADGKYPQGSVTVDSSGNLYGTAPSGGANGFGIIWKISVGGGYTDVHDFGAIGDGRLPKGSIVFDSNGTMYGTTSSGGAYSNGTAWKLTAGGTYSDLHDFGDSTDGANPYGNVTLDSSGNLYGTTYNGGANSYGMIWKITAGGTYSDVHDFGVGLDGQNPAGSVSIDGSGSLYGTASFGGGTGNGMVWKISSAGTYADLYDFQDGTDGENPEGNVTVDSFGNLYGTAAYGGSTDNGMIWELAFKPTTLALSAASTSGGSSLMGTIRLEVPATSPTTITLASSSVFAAVPPSITVPVGSQLVTFPIWTDPCLTTQPVTITATNGLNVPSASLNLTAYSPFVFNVQVAPTYIVGGTIASGLVQLDHFVTTVGGEVVDLSSSNVVGNGTASAIVPASVVVPFGSNSVSFSIVTSAVSSVTGVNISATDGGTQSGLLMLTPSNIIGLGLSVSPGGIYGGSSATGTVTLSSAQGTATVVNLSSNSANVAVPSTVTVPAGSTSANFTVNTSPVSGTTAATSGGWIWVACSTGLSSQAVPTALYPASLHYISASPSSVTGGASSTGTLYLNGNAPTGGVTVSLGSTSPDLQVPSTVTVPAGSSSTTFNITTSRVNSAESLSITASYGGKTTSCGFAIGASVAVHFVTVSPSTVIGGAVTTGSVTLTAVAPASGTTVTLASSDPSAQVPATLLIPAGSLSATFPITTYAVGANTSVSISAALNGHSANYGLIVSAPTFLGLSFSSPTLISENSVLVATATLNGPAPAGGTVISLSSNSSAASVPASVTIPAGATSATFPIQTYTVSSPVTVTITGQHTQTAHLTFKLIHA